MVLVGLCLLEWVVGPNKALLLLLAMVLLVVWCGVVERQGWSDCRQLGRPTTHSLCHDLNEQAGMVAKNSQLHC